MKNLIYLITVFIFINSTLAGEGGMAGGGSIAMNNISNSILAKEGSGIGGGLISINDSIILSNTLANETNLKNLSNTITIVKPNSINTILLRDGFELSYPDKGMTLPQESVDKVLFINGSSVSFSNNSVHVIE